MPDMSPDEFRRAGHEVVDWIADYLAGIRDYPVVSRVQPGELPAAYVQRLSIEKSARALEELTVGDGYILLAADTAVVVGTQTLGKPRDAEDAARMLRLLSGRTHRVQRSASRLPKPKPRQRERTSYCASS